MLNTLRNLLEGLLIRSLQRLDRLVGLIRTPRTTELSFMESVYLQPHWVYRLKFVRKYLTVKTEKMKEHLLRLSRESAPHSIMKLGDGDYYFLRGIPLGSARPGARAISQELGPGTLAYYQAKSLEVDEYACELIPSNLFQFQMLFPSKRIDYPAECLYLLVASRWITSALGTSLGLIGSQTKLRMIEDLMRFEQYRQYVGLDNFTDYIGVPDKFAADNPEVVIEQVHRDLTLSTAKVFLVGVGHLKSALLPNLAQFWPALYIDIGSGIDALAGIIDTRRPFMGSWRNFRVSGSKTHLEADLLDFDGGNLVHLA